MQNLFGMLSADLTLVNDLSLLYRGWRCRTVFVLTGPWTSRPAIVPTSNPCHCPRSLGVSDQTRSTSLHDGQLREGEIPVEAVPRDCIPACEQSHAVVLVRRRSALSKGFGLSWPGA